jgi:hypothetical protein
MVLPFRAEGEDEKAASSGYGKNGQWPLMGTMQTLLQPSMPQG